MTKEARHPAPAAVSVAAVLVLLVSSVAWASGGHAGPIHVNWWAWDMESPPVGWFLLDFLVFVWLLWHFGRRPVRQAFADRHERLRNALETIERELERTREEFETYRDKLGRVEEEMAELVARGRAQGKEDLDHLESAGRTFAERIRQDSTRIIAQEEERAQRRVRRRVFEDTLHRAEEMLRVLDEGTQRRLLEEAVSDLEKTLTHRREAAA